MELHAPKRYLKACDIAENRSLAHKI